MCAQMCGTQRAGRHCPVAFVYLCGVCAVCVWVGGGFAISGLLPRSRRPRGNPHERSRRQRHAAPDGWQPGVRPSAAPCPCRQPTHPWVVGVSLAEQACSRGRGPGGGGDGLRGMQGVEWDWPADTVPSLLVAAPRCLAAPFRPGPARHPQLSTPTTRPPGPTASRHQPCLVPASTLTARGVARGVQLLRVQQVAGGICGVGVTQQHGGGGQGGGRDAQKV